MTVGVQFNIPAQVLNGDVGSLEHCHVVSQAVLRKSSGSFLYFSRHLNGQALLWEGLCTHVDLLLARDLISSVFACLQG